MIMGIASGIEFLHLNKIIHVDIKPQNIMVDSNDNKAKLVDFGFSRHADWEGTHRSTDKIIDAIDPKLKEDGWDIFALEEALTIANIALRRAHLDKAERPDMNLVLTELTSMMSCAHNHITLAQEEEEEISIITSM
ncbi:hypothetical protein SUGI_0859300 [Cryptomeria japonica]|nr:hypothetical protein SUGI_0859300 [Cryptomeria japonica]